MTDATHKPSRCRSGSETRQRHAVVALRVIAAEAEALAVAADRTGLPVSAYVRRMVFGRRGVRAVRRLPSPPRLELARVLGLFGRIGGNVNQLAKALNAAATSPAASELAAIRVEILALREALMWALDPDHQGR